MKKYRVTLKAVYEVQAVSPSQAADIAQDQLVNDGIGSLAATVAEVKPKVVVDEGEMEEDNAERD